MQIIAVAMVATFFQYLSAGELAIDFVDFLEMIQLKKAYAELQTKELAISNLFFQVEFTFESVHGEC